MVRRGSAVRVRQRALLSKKYLQIGYCRCLTEHRRAPPCSIRTTATLLASQAKCLQIDLLTGTTEHLPDTEGLDVYRRRRCTKVAGKRTFPIAPLDPMH